MKRHHFVNPSDDGDTRDQGFSGGIHVLVSSSDNKNRIFGKKRRRSTVIYMYCALVLGVGLLLSLLKRHGTFLDNENREPVESNTSKPGQFPRYGTEEFARQCSWTMAPSSPAAQTPPNASCTFFVSPSPKESEGISRWIADVAAAYFFSRETNCGLLFDYGPNISIHEVLTPLIFFPKSGQQMAKTATTLSPFNWTVPKGFECESPLCVRVGNRFGGWRALQDLKDAIGREEPILKGPDYREAYVDTLERSRLRPSYYKKIADTILPGFRPETGMACAMASLLQLSPFASKFEPKIFSTILPTLHEPNTFVISLYMRTNHADYLADQKKSTKPQVPYDEKHRAWDEQIANATTTCALQVEQEHLSSLSSRRSSKSTSSVVWMLITDSPEMKERIVNAYDTTKMESRPASPFFTRRVVTTSSGGGHSKPSINPSTADFAQAFLDWYLIGESDVVVNHGGSYGHTAAARTNRPFYAAETYRKKTCSLVPIFGYEKDSSKVN